MPSIFTRILSGEIPGYILAEEEHFAAILDAFPLVRGHALVIPKVEVDYIFDMDDNILKEFHVFAKKIAIAQKKAIDCKKIGMAVIGLEVPHAHIHLIPMNQVQDMNFSNPKINLEKKEMQEIQERIKSFLK